MQQENINNLEKLVKDIYDSNGLYWKFTQYIEFQDETIIRLFSCLKRITQHGNDTDLTIEEFFNKLHDVISDTQEIATSYSFNKAGFEKYLMDETKNGRNNSES